MIVGNFDFVDGHQHQSIVRLTYNPYSPPTGHLTISGPDTVSISTNSDTVSYALPDSLAFTWNYTGNNTIFVNNVLDPVQVSFGPGATGGVLSASATGYCGASNLTAQKTITVNHVLPTPTTNACCMSFYNRQPTRLSLQFTPGNGSGRLIVASTSSVPTPPARATAYAANANFGSGADLGGGTFAVYAGTADSLTVTGLQPSTGYYFTVYEYNGSGDSIVYLTSQAYTNYAVTLATEPRLAPSNIHFSNIGPSSLTIYCNPG